MPKGPVIAIDGPAAAGKGTLARGLATSLGLPHLDTGLLYRAVGRRVLDAGGDPADPVAATAAAQALRPEDLTRSDLRGPAADTAAAAVAALPAVRAALLDFQRGFPGENGAVLDGRDIGSSHLSGCPGEAVRDRFAGRESTPTLAGTAKQGDRRRTWPRSRPTCGRVTCATGPICRRPTTRC